MSAAASATVPLFGLQFDDVTMGEALERIEQLVEQRAPSYVVTPNVDHVVRLERDPSLRPIYEGAALVLADGMPIVWAARLLGRPIRERVTGADLLPALCARADIRGWRVFLLGAAPGVAARAGERLRQQLPGLQVCGALAPDRGFERVRRLDEQVIEQVRAARPDVLLVALGSPRQERWIHEHLDDLQVPVSLGIGAAIDFAAGEVRRAPRWMQRAGLEWGYRLLREPRRLARRYLVDDARFVPMCARAVWQERIARRHVSGRG